MVENLKPNILILDLMMPRLGGVNTEYISASGQAGESVVLILDLKKIISDQDIRETV